MKILHINTERTWRGGEQQTFYLLDGLKEQNIAAHLVCQPDSPMAERAKAAGIKTFAISMHGEADPVACFHIRRLVKQFNYDILHSHTSHAHTLAFGGSIGTGAKRLVTRRVDYSIFRHSFLKMSGIKYRYMGDFYVAVSHEIKRVLINDGLDQERIFVIHSGIDPDRFKESTPEHLISEFNIQKDQQVIINVAHLAWHKGQKYLIRAAALVLSRFPKVRFFIVGGGKLMDELRSLSASLDLDNRLILTGFRSDVGAFYQLADLFVMSSVKEGLGTAILDAIALGKPVVATRAGGVPEIIEDGITGRLVPPADPAALAAGIEKMLTDDESARQMAAKGQGLVMQRFTDRVMVVKYIELYRKILTLME